MRIEGVRRADAPAAEVAARLRAQRPDAGGGDVPSVVRGIVDRVRRGGDRAVLELTRELDTGGREPAPLRVAEEELSQALEAIDPELRDALELAAANVRRVAVADLAEERAVELPAGQRVVLRSLPVRRAAVYVPGGRAPYPSTVVMGAVTAQAAGVEDVVVCAPPKPDGSAHAEILAACALCGVGEVYRMGGAQAVAALALGAGPVEPVDVLVGPGNDYVQEAKRQLSDRVGIDSFAGPSELLAVLDEGADPRLAALDLLAQGEHGPATRLAAVSPSAPLLEAVGAEMASLGADGNPAAECLLIEVEDVEEALAFAEAFAPEHLQLAGPRAEALAPAVRSAGCVFVGARSGTAFGDYIAGSNHVLPTGGTARFASVLSPATFRRRMAEVHVSEAARALAGPGAAIARAEGFVMHARSMEARIEDNGDNG